MGDKVIPTTSHATNSYTNSGYLKTVARLWAAGLLRNQKTLSSAAFCTASSEVTKNYPASQEFINILRSFFEQPRKLNWVTRPRACAMEFDMLNVETDDDEDVDWPLYSAAKNMP